MKSVKPAKPLEPTVSQRVIALVRHTLGRSDFDVRVTDQSVAKALKISRPVFIEIRKGNKAMPLDSFARAMKLADVDPAEAADFQARLFVDLAADADVRDYAQKALAWIREHASRQGPLAGIAMLAFAALHPQAAHAGTLVHPAADPISSALLYILRKIRNTVELKVLRPMSRFVNPILSRPENALLQI